MIKLEVRLSVRARVDGGEDGGEDGGVVKVDISFFAMLFMRSNARHTPLPATNVAFVFRHSRFRFPRRFSDICVSSIVFTVAVEFINNLTRGEFCFVFSANDVLKTDARCEDYG